MSKLVPYAFVDFALFYHSKIYKMCLFKVIVCRTNSGVIFYLQSTTNILVREAAERKVGVFSIPVNALHISTGEDALRAIDPHHIGDLRREMIVEYDNGHEVSLPPAIGVIMNVGTLPTDKHELQRKLEGGKINVRVIDGNHTTQVIKELNETYPEAGCFQKRYLQSSIPFHISS